MEHFVRMWAAPLYRTTDFGQTWSRLLSEKQAKGYALCFLQDPAEPRLLFAGTEHGLWVSIDAGHTWTQWDNGLPAATPVMDLAIQEREADLVIGTFGRSIYVLDNIRPLRQLAATGSSLLDKPVLAFEPSTAYHAVYQGPQGYGKDAEDLYQATNRPAGATLLYYLKPAQKAVAAKPAPTTAAVKGKKPAVIITSDEPTTSLPLTASAIGPLAARGKIDSVFVRLYDESNRLVRTLKQVPDTALGVQRINWNLTETAVSMPSMPGPRRGGNEPSGDPVMPGKYKAVVTYRGAADSTYVTVLPDPRVPFNKEAAMARRALQERLNKNIRQLSALTSQIQEATEATESIKSRLKDKKGPQYDDLRKATAQIQDSLKVVRERIVGKRTERQGFGRVYMLTPIMKIQEASSYISRRTAPPTQTESQLTDQAEGLTRETIAKTNEFFSKQWAEYYKKVQATPLDLIKEYSPIASNPK